MSTITRTKNSRVQALDTGDQGLEATELRSDNYDNRARSRCQANSSVSGWAAGRLPLYAHACRARQTACWMIMSQQIQANSRGNRDGAATGSAGRTSVALAAGWKQNTAKRSYRQTFTH